MRLGFSGWYSTPGSLPLLDRTLHFESRDKKRPFHPLGNGKSADALREVINGFPQVMFTKILDHLLLDLKSLTTDDD